MEKFNEATKIMIERFSKDSILAVATTDGKYFYNRMIDAIYVDGSFYLTSNALSNKVVQIEAHPEVAICAVDWFTGHGIGKNLGWVLDPKNQEIRAKLREAFSAWYDHAINEEDKNSCILEIRLTDGILIKGHNEICYQIDFSNKSAVLS